MVSLDAVERSVAENPYFHGLAPFQQKLAEHQRLALQASVEIAQDWAVCEATHIRAADSGPATKESI
jgi:hypothetical protein